MVAGIMWRGGHGPRGLTSAAAPLSETAVGGSISVQWAEDRVLQESTGGATLMLQPPRRALVAGAV